VILPMRTRLTGPQLGRGADSNSSSGELANGRKGGRARAAPHHLASNSAFMFSNIFAFDLALFRRFDLDSQLA